MAKISDRDILAAVMDEIRDLAETRLRDDGLIIETDAQATHLPIHTVVSDEFETFLCLKNGAVVKIRAEFHTS